MDIDLAQVRKDVEAALESVGQEHGLQLTLGHITYDATSFVGQLKGAQIIGGVAATPERTEFKFAAHGMGLHPALLDFEFTDSEGNRLKIAGLNSRAKRYPIKLNSVDGGRNIKCTVDWLLPYVEEALERLAKGQSI